MPHRPPPSARVAPLCALLALALPAAPRPASAQSAASPGAPERAPLSAPLSALHELRVAVGAAVAVQGSFISKPKSEYYQQPGILWDVPYSGYGGVGGAGAASVEVAWRALGLSVGYTHSVDAAEGKINGQALSLSQTTHHVPLTLRAELPTALVRPSLFGGVDWVSVSGTALQAPPGTGYSDARADSYRAWIFGLGFDALLGPRLRLPVRLYGVFNPAPRDTLNDVIEPQLSLSESGGLGFFRLKSEWVWQAGISVGVSFDVYQRPQGGGQASDAAVEGM